MNLPDITVEELGGKRILSLIQLYENKAYRNDREKDTVIADTVKKIEEEYAARSAEYIATARGLKEFLCATHIICPKCNGKGTVTEYTNMHDDRGHSEKCDGCDGKGVYPKPLR